MGETAKVTTDDGAFEAYVARPAAGGGGAAVVVIQEIFGVNAVMREITDRLAGHGYLAICPDLFWRIEPGVQLTDKTEADWKRAFQLFNAFDVDAGVGDIAATIDHVRADPASNDKVGVVGFCLGGLLAFLTAARTDADASVSFYGVGLESRVAEAEKLARPLQMHIAEQDQFMPPAAQKIVLQALKPHPSIEIYTYPGCDHAFARPGGEHFDARAAKLAAGRSLEFLGRHLS
jgi:carboxymethylenebutenolidase